MPILNNNNQNNSHNNDKVYNDNDNRRIFNIIIILLYEYIDDNIEYIGYDSVFCMHIIIIWTYYIWSYDEFSPIIYLYVATCVRATYIDNIFTYMSGRKFKESGSLYFIYI